MTQDEYDTKRLELWKKRNEDVENLNKEISNVLKKYYEEEEKLLNEAMRLGLRLYEWGKVNK